MTCAPILVINITYNEAYPVTYRGRVEGRVVVLEDGVRLPEGAAVLVTLAEAVIESKSIPRAFHTGSLEGDTVIFDLLQGLQGWSAGQCDGEWEHHHGIEITTLDDPG